MPEFNYNKYSSPIGMQMMQPGAPRDPNLVAEQHFLQKLSGERVRAEAEKENRLEQAYNLLNSWNSGKIKEKELFDNFKILQTKVVGETEKKKFEVIQAQTKEKVITRNLENKERELQSSYLQGKFGIDEIYNQYSGLARVAAMANLTELSTTLMLHADLYLKQMKDEIKRNKAVLGDSFLEKFFADFADKEDIMETAPIPISKPRGKEIPLREIQSRAPISIPLKSEPLMSIPPGGIKKPETEQERIKRQNKEILFNKK